jgi:hypothetical protein
MNGSGACHQISPTARTGEQGNSGPLVGHSRRSRCVFSDCEAMVASLQGRRYILGRQKQSRKIPHNLPAGFVEVSLQISACFSKEYRESLRYQCIDSEGPRYASWDSVNLPGDGWRIPHRSVRKMNRELIQDCFSICGSFIKQPISM